MLDEVFTQLGDVITTIAGLEVDSLTDAELDALVVGVQRAGQQLAGAGAAALARWDATQVWRTDGSLSAAKRLARDAGTSKTTAHVALRRVRTLAAMPIAATAPPLCELANGVVIAPGVLVPYLGAAELETILFDGPFTVIAASSARTFTGRLRRAIEVRDRRCQHPSGCDTNVDRCDVDHIVPHGLGGKTTQFNGRLECRPHNRDATKHDHDATPHPERPVTVLDEIRSRLRWQHLHHDDPDDPDEPAA